MDVIEPNILKQPHKPIEGGVITSGYGWRINPITQKREFHSGIDIGVAGNPRDIPVYVTKPGVIKWIDKTRVFNPETGAGSFGVVVYVLMKDGWYAIYPHQDSLLISTMVGVIVDAGTKLGIMGKTGLSTEVHLHYQERTSMAANGKSREPIDIINLYTI